MFPIDKRIVLIVEEPFVHRQIAGNPQSIPMTPKYLFLYRNGLAKPHYDTLELSEKSALFIQTVVVTHIIFLNF